MNRSGQNRNGSLLTNIAHALKHRGPDGHGQVCRNGIAVGNQRLAIIDVEGGHQPFMSDDHQIAVVQNGEIFNYVELAEELARRGVLCKTHSDTEVLLRLYESEGIKFAEKLNGMFAIAIADFRTNNLYLIRDRVGVKPLYLFEDGDTLWFASEIKGLLSAGAKMEVDDRALDLYLTFNFVPPPITMFRQIRHLPPGHIAQCSRAGVQVRRWWHPYQVASDSAIDQRAWADEFNHILEDAVRIRLRSDVPVGAFLSGGVDSSTIVGLMSRLSPRQIQSFSIGFEDSRFDESPYARAAADRFGTMHFSEEVKADVAALWPRITYFCDQPHGDASFLPTYRVASLAARNLKVVLTGDGGDELFAGYDKYASFFAESFHDTEAQFERAYFEHLSLFSEEAKSKLYSADFARRVKGAEPFEVVESIFRESRHFDRINRALYLDLLLLLPGNNLVKPDRMGMAVSLEARTPFLDRRMIEFAFRTPGSLKLKDGETKYLLKRAVAPLIGESLAYREKRMFTLPIGEWFKGVLHSYCREILLSERSMARGLFNVERVREMLDQHLAAVANWTRELRALVALELWFRVFVDAQQGFSEPVIGSSS